MPIGVLFLFPGLALAGVVLTSCCFPCRAAATAPDDEAEVELQLQRISDALMPEYRREAVGQLKELLTDNPKVCAR